MREAVTTAWLCASAVPLAIALLFGAQECALEVPEWAPRGSARTARPEITATFRSSCGAAIDIGSVRMTVDDKPVMPSTKGSAADVTVRYVPGSALLQEEDHTVTVQAQDANGVKGERTWTFHVPDTYLR